MEFEHLIVICKHFNGSLCHGRHVFDVYYEQCWLYHASLWNTTAYVLKATRVIVSHLHTIQCFLPVQKGLQP